MTVTQTITARSGGVVNTACGKFTSDGSAQTLTLGFVPSLVKVFNETDAIVWEGIRGMSSTIATKILTAGTTADTGSAIVINTDGTVTLSSTLCGTSKVIVWYASV